METAPKPNIVSSLLCARDLDHGIACYQSLLRASREPVRLVIYDDGSLGEAGWDRIEDCLPGSRVVARADAESRVEPILANYPRCAEFRRRSVFGIKLFDEVLLSDTEVVTHIDSDILWHAPFVGLFNNTRRLRLLRDPACAYSVRFDLRTIQSPVRFAGYANAGLFQLPKKLYDLEFLESLLGRPELFSAQRVNWWEQTIWAALGAKVDCDLIAPEQIRCSHFADRARGSVATHYVSGTRERLSEEIEERPEEIEGDAIQIMSAPAPVLGVVRILANKAWPHLLWRLGISRL